MSWGCASARSSEFQPTHLVPARAPYQCFGVPTSTMPAIYRCFAAIQGRIVLWGGFVGCPTFADFFCPPRWEHEPQPAGVSSPRRMSGKNPRHGLAAKARSQVLCEQCIGLRSRHGLLYVLAMILIRRGECDERRGEFHFRIIASLLDGSFHPGASIHSRRGTRFTLSTPLFVRFGQVAKIKPRQRSESVGGSFRCTGAKAG